MNLLELNDEELKSFLEVGVPEKLLRDIYVNFPKISQKLKGFRPKTAPKKFLVNTSFSIIKSKKDAKLIEILTDYYNDNDKEIKDSQKKYEKDGYSQLIALALSIKESTNEEFRPIYFKLEHFDATTQRSITEIINMLNLIEMISSTIVKDLLHENLDNLIENFDSKLKIVNEEIVKLKNCLREYSDLYESFKEKSNKKITDIDEKLGITLQHEREITIKKVEQLQLVQNDVAIKMQNQIDFLKQQLEKLNANKPKGFSIKVIENKNYEVFDEHLLENIGDIIENVVKNNEFNILREYLVEIIFSKKPIIVAEKNVNLLVNLISSTITGGNYYEVILEDSCSMEQLVVELEQLKSVANNKVVVIRDFRSNSNPQQMWEYIKVRPFNEKYIFCITYEREIQFMPPEILNRFNFFIGKFESTKVAYKYAYSFENENRKKIINGDYEKILSSLDIEIDNKDIINVNYYGLLSYSHIPFKSIHDSIDIDELINKIMIPSIRSKCEAIIHD